jgi:hypothetical protein
MVYYYKNSSYIPVSTYGSRSMAYLSKKRKLGPFMGGSGEASRILKALKTATNKSTTGTHSLNELTGASAQEHSGAGMYYVQCYLQKKKKKFLNGMPTTYNHTYGGIMVANAGRQYSQTIGAFATNRSFVDATVTNLTANFDGLATPLFDLIKNKTFTGGGIITGENNSAMLYLENMIINLSMTNYSNGPVDVELYFITPKKSTNLDPREAMDEGFADQRHGLGDAGFSGAGLLGATAGADTKEHLWNSPNSSEKFNELYHVLKMRRLILGAGSSATVKSHVDAHSLWEERLTREEYDNSFRHAGPYRSFYIHAVARGFPIQDETGTSTTSTQKVDVGYVINCRYKLREAEAMFDSARVTYRHQNISTDAASADQKHIGNADNEITDIDV